METIAVYFEPVIRTYGFNLKENLFLCQLTFKTKNLGSWGRKLRALAKLSVNFHLVWACPLKLGEIKFFLLCDDECRDDVIKFIKNQKISEISEYIQCESAMELIYFQGPHFGDRYGIADFTLAALHQQKIPIKAMACSGAAVYLVFSHFQGTKAKAALSNAFEVPNR